MKAFFYNIIVACSIIYGNCGYKAAAEKDMPVPSIYVQAGSPSLKQSDGILYYKQSPFSGCIYEVYDTGDTASLASFYNGRQWGMARSWYPGHSPEEIRRYTNGHKTGEHRGWWQNGRLKFIYHFTDDEYNGTVQEWYADGQQYRSMHYRAGKEEGRQQVWRPNGTLHANYVAVNGRNYGLTGTMHCKNIFTRE